ncbi:hypothetical protein, partial [Mesorhizobium sp. M7A.T.Ca.TU.009.02.1.1]|uniref:hypothetical protein n=1 Tax=Mesorhizobium sp. M7A.T.Ca.TU.009.02.1.1 TaxID=2496791 RepID=UPI0013E31763
GDGPWAATGDQADDAAGQELGDVQRAVGGAVEGTDTDAAAPVAADAVEESQDAAGPTAEAGQTADAQPQQAGPAQEEAEGLTNGQEEEGTGAAAGSSADMELGEAQSGPGTNAGLDGGGGAGAGETAAGVVNGGTKSVAPLYLCHKQVRALKIGAVEILPEGRSKIAPKDEAYAPFLAPSGWGARFHGSEDDPGYYVLYEDGYASWSPTKAFEDGYSLMPADQRDDLTFKTPLDVAELARGVGAAARYFADGGGSEPDIFAREEAAIMADFVRDNPDAPVEAMFIHLSLKKRYPRTEPNRADLFVLSLFHAACKAAIAFEADQAAEEAAAKTKPAPSGGWPGDRALQPSKPAMSPTGFSPR